MAANRMDTGKGDADKRPEAAPMVEAPKAQAAAGVGGWLPLIGAVVLLPIIAYLVTTFVLVPKLQKGLGITPPPAAASTHEGEGGGHGSAPAQAPAKGRQQVPIAKTVVNVAKTQATRFLMVSMILVSDADNFAAVVKEHEAQLKDVAGGILSAKSIEDLERPGARNMIRSELITAFNHIFGGTTVQEIYFTDFAIQ